ncbi:MAG: hypothetical protein KJ915_00420 [Candidatus Omnitrophica bacterium]|nr:hypothetical protein [Candidatus Omnitrophota bacterium]
MKKKILISMIMMISFVCIFSGEANSQIIGRKTDGSESEGLQKWILKLSNSLGVSSRPNVVAVSSDDTAVTAVQSANEETALTPIQTATSVASGLIASGTIDKSVVKATLMSYGYGETEAEIAFTKASTNNVLDNMMVVPVVDKITISQESTMSTLAPGNRVKQGLKPQSKFQKGRIANYMKDPKQTVRQDEINTTTEMLDEGYTVVQVAQGFAANGYTSAKTAAIFQASGISAKDAYNALSSMGIGEGKGSILKSWAAVFKRFGSNVMIKDRQETQKQEAIKSTVNDLASAGYDVTEVLGVVVQDLKDTGMTAQQTNDFLIEKVADGTGKPIANFRNAGNISLSSIVGVIQGRKNGGSVSMTSYGQGEIALASAMIKAGYSTSEVASSFKTGSYSYTNADTQKILSQTNISNPASPDTTTNNNTQEDLLKRNTQALPI